LEKYGPNLQVGVVGDENTPPVTEKPAKKQMQLPMMHNTFGELVPMGDPTWYQAWNSPFYNETHIKFRAAIRAFVEKELMPFCHEWDEAKSLPKDLAKKCFEAGKIHFLLLSPKIEIKSRDSQVGYPLSQVFLGLLNTPAPILLAVLNQKNMTFSTS
jgi:hypothetical protein